MLSYRKQSGFTLIELMVVVAIIGILSSIAYSSYRNSVVRSNRAAAVSYLLEVANMQERFLLDNRSYAASMAELGATVPGEVSANYTVTTGDNGTANTTYKVEATPTGSQASDDTDCGKLTLTNLGAKSSQYGGSRCWN